MLKTPSDFLPAFEKALKDVALSMHNPALGRIDDEAFHIGLEGSFGDNQLSPRFLSAKYLGQMVCLEGIVTRCTFQRHFF